MTYGEAKRRVLSLLDETRPKAELLCRLPAFFDLAQREVAGIAPLKKCRTLQKEEGAHFVPLPEDFWKVRRLWQLDGEGGRRAVSLYAPYPGKLYLDEGQAMRLELEYNAKPATIDENTPDSALLELSEQAQDAMLFFVAAQCHATEYDQRFFTSFYAQYQGRLANLAANEPAAATVVAVDGGAL